MTSQIQMLLVQEGKENSFLPHALERMHERGTNEKVGYVVDKVNELAANSRKIELKIYAVSI